VALEAGLAEQTVYNYFLTKEQFVAYHDQQVQDRLGELTQGIALAGVFQIIISEAGRLAREAKSRTTIADELYPIVENILDELDRWLSVSGPPAPRRP
jgi:AcrR family transcriptional regulator